MYYASFTLHCRDITKCLLLRSFVFGVYHEYSMPFNGRKQRTQQPAYYINHCWDTGLDLFNHSFISSFLNDFRGPLTRHWWSVISEYYLKMLQDCWTYSAPMGIIGEGYSLMIWKKTSNVHIIYSSKHTEHTESTENQFA